MEGYLSEFFALALIHFLAVVSPGPDLAITTANSIRYGRKIGVLTAIGIGCGISIHVIYSLAGLSFLQNHPLLFSLIRLAGAGYLLYLAYLLLKSQPQKEQAFSAEQNAITPKKAFLNGFVTNMLNPKAVLFFVAIFSTIVSPKIPLALKIVYGLWMCSVNALWFILLWLFFLRVPVSVKPF